MTKDDIDIKDYIRNFLNGCIEVKKRRDAGSTEAKGLPGIIKNKPYRGTYVKQVLQQGKIAYCPFMVFEGYGQVATNGIYPALLFNSQTSVLEICYACSATEKTNNKWGEIYTSGLSKSTTEDYKESLVKKSYTINNDKDIEDNIDDIIDCLDKVIDDFHEQFRGADSIKTDNEDTDLNIILYGPPGTGKTYNTVVEAMKIIAPEKYKEYEAGNDYGVLKAAFDEYRKQNRIEFVTFHQSFSYEEFVEGIKPVIDDEGEDTDRLGYRIEDGIFKKICENAETPIIHENNNIGLNKEPKIWKISLKGTGDNEIRKYCMEHDCIRIGYYEDSQEGKRVFSAFANRMNVGDIVISCFSQTTFDAIGVVTGEYYLDENFNDYRSVREVKWLIKGVKQDILAINKGKKFTLGAVYQLNSVSAEDVLNIINNSSSKEKVSYEENNQPYVLIIDEINRGNISKIFGELITLIEPDKRIGAEHELRVSLPYTKDKLFGVPKNLYIIGTMNTSDRSIASIDIALRRRFKFKEMMPRDDLVADFGIGFGDIFKDLNLKIKLLLDRDHQIGHSYFMNPKNNNVTELKRIWFDRIIPLLNEYFYCDWEKLKLVVPGFIKDIFDDKSIPEALKENLKNECEENHYEFKTYADFQDDDDFVKALSFDTEEENQS